MVSSEDTGRDFEHCQRLQKKMKEFDQDLAVEAARVETINKLAEKLVSQGHAGSADITNRQQALNERWNRLQDRASERRQQLAEACEMHAFDQDCKDVSDLISEKVSRPLRSDQKKNWKQKFRKIARLGGKFRKHSGSLWLLKLKELRHGLRILKSLA